MAKHKETASEKTQAPAAYGKHLISRQVPETVVDTAPPDIGQPAEEPAPAAGFVDVPVITPDDLPKIAIEKDGSESKSSLKPKLESVLKLKLKPEPKSEPERLIRQSFGMSRYRIP